MWPFFDGECCSLSIHAAIWGDSSASPARSGRSWRWLEIANMLLMKDSVWKLPAGPWGCCDLCGSLVFMCGRWGCLLDFCSGIKSPGLGGACRACWGEQRALQVASVLSSELQVGFVFQDKPTWSDWRGDPLQKSIWEYQYGGKKMSICCCFLLPDILGSSIPVCFLGVCRLCVHVFSHALPMCMHLSIFQQVGCTPSSPISGIHACRMRRENQGCSQRRHDNFLKWIKQE